MLTNRVSQFVKDWAAVLYRLAVGALSAVGSLCAIKMAPAASLALVSGIAALSLILQSALSSPSQRLFLTRIKRSDGPACRAVDRRFLAYLLNSMAIGFVAAIALIGMDGFGAAHSGFENVALCLLYAGASPAVVAQRYAVAINKVGIYFAHIVSIALIYSLAILLDGFFGAVLFQFGGPVAASVVTFWAVAADGGRFSLGDVSRRFFSALRPRKNAARYIWVEVSVALFGVVEQLLFFMLPIAEVSRSYLFALRFAGYVSSLAGLVAIRVQLDLAKRHREKIDMPLARRVMKKALYLSLISAGCSLAAHFVFLPETCDVNCDLSALALPVHALCGCFVLTAFTSAMANSSLISRRLALSQSFILLSGCVLGALGFLFADTVEALTTVRAITLLVLALLHFRYITR